MLPKSQNGFVSCFSFCRSIFSIRNYLKAKLKASFFLANTKANVENVSPWNCSWMRLESFHYNLFWPLAHSRPGESPSISFLSITSNYWAPAKATTALGSHFFFCAFWPGWMEIMMVGSRQSLSATLLPLVWAFVIAQMLAHSSASQQLQQPRHVAERTLLPPKPIASIGFLSPSPPWKILRLFCQLHFRLGRFAGILKSPRGWWGGFWLSLTKIMLLQMCELLMSRCQLRNNIVAAAVDWLFMWLYAIRHCRFFKFSMLCLKSRWNSNGLFAFLLL